MASVRTDKVQLELDVKADQAKTELDNLLRKEKLLVDELKGMKKGTDEYIQKNKELKEVQTQMSGVQKQLGLTGMSYNQLDKMAKQMNRELRGMVEGTEAFTQKSKELQQVEARLNQVKNAAKGIKQEQEQAGGGWKDFLGKAAAFSGINMGIEAVVDGAIAAGKAVAETVKEFQDLRAEIHGLTGASGEELDGLTTSVAAVAKTFDKDFNEVLIASNALSKQMGISQQEAINLIEKGFVAGADASGEFLDQVKEYPGQFKAAGASADEMMAIITQSVTSGVFSDKGADVVKEFGLRIREQTPAVRDALDGAFGEQFTGKLFDGLNKGTITTVDALKLVSEGLNDTELTAAQAQLVIADVFGGPGEDAGIDYLKSLKNIGTGMDDLINTNDIYVQRQQGLLQSQKDLAASQNELAKEFEGGSTILETLTNDSLTFLYSLLVGLIGVFGDVFAPIGRLWTSLGTLAEKLGLVSKEGNMAKTVAEYLSFVMSALFFPVRMVYTGFEYLITTIAEFVQSSPRILGPLQSIIGGIKALFNALGDAPAYLAGFKAAFVEVFSNVAQMAKMAFTGDFDGLKKTWANFGSGVSKSFNDAYEKELKAGNARQLEEDKKLQEEKKKQSAGISAEEKKRRDKEAEDRRKARLKELEEQKKQELEAAKTIEDLQNELIKNQYDRKIATLRTQAQREKAEAKGSVEQIAQQHILLDKKLSVDLQAIEKERAAAALKIAQDLAIKQRDIRRKALMDEAELEVQMASRKGPGGAVMNEEALLSAKLKQLDLMKRIELEKAQEASKEKLDQDIKNLQLSGEEKFNYEMDGLMALNNEKLLIEENFQQQKNELNRIYTEDARRKELEGLAGDLQNAQQWTQEFFDFKKISNDREMTQLDKNKQKRLKDLDNEFKAGKISKENYEAEKGSIESSYDEKTRKLKRKAAEDEKSANIANSIMSGIIAVLKAGGPLTATGIATAIFAALSTAKIIATPVPTFGSGGVFSKIGSMAKAGVSAVKRMFANGGAINPVAGVAGAGQLHSNGGIKMLDGATGEYLGEWERGEPYMILSRATMANNGDIINQLLDSSLNRGGAPIRAARGGIYAEDGAVVGTLPGTAAAAADNSAALINQVVGLRNDLNSWNTALKAYVVSTEIRDGLGELKDIETESGL